MAEDTPISWARHTFNLWWGCDEPGAAPGTDFIEGTDRAPECLNCYARAWDHRMGGNHWGPGQRKFAGEKYWAKPIKWNADAQRAGVRASVFCQSMGDWAELHPDPAINAQLDAARARLWQLVRSTPWLDWLMLTKRVDRLTELLPWTRDPHAADLPVDPWPNVWPGTTCGARSSLWRVERLRTVPAVVRFVSAEPLTEHITGEDWDSVLGPAGFVFEGDRLIGRKHSIHWLIVGDESHHDPKKRRAAQLDWIRTAREAALRNQVAFHFKQWNGPSSVAVHGQRTSTPSGTGTAEQSKGKIHLPVLDGRVHAGYPGSDE